jgi:chromosome segregation ATPase
VRKKAAQVLRSLRPCKDIQQAEFQAAKIEAAAARKDLERATDCLSQVHARHKALQGDFESELGRAPMSVHALRMWRSSLAMTISEMAKFAEELRGIDANVERAREHVALSDGSMRAIEKALRAAERALGRQRDEAALDASDETRRKKRAVP